jgi:hypothetical protein
MILVIARIDETVANLVTIDIAEIAGQIETVTEAETETETATEIETKTEIFDMNVIQMIAIINLGIEERREATALIHHAQHPVIQHRQRQEKEVSINAVSGQA